MTVLAAGKNTCRLHALQLSSVLCGLIVSVVERRYSNSQAVLGLAASCAVDTVGRLSIDATPTDNLWTARSRSVILVA